MVVGSCSCARSSNTSVSDRWPNDSMLTPEALQHAALETIRRLPPDQPLTVTLLAGDVVRALEQRAGPETLTTEQAAERYGHSEDWWRRRAAANEISGAYQLSDGAPW